MKNVLVVDDQSIICYGTIQLLKDFFPGVDVAAAKDVDEMVDQLNKKQFELVILDINIPGGNNFGMLDIIKLRQPSIKILIFSGYDEKIYAQRYVNAGAHGFVSKQASEKELFLAINSIFKGKTYFSAELKDQLKQEKDKTSEENPLSLLSNREIEVMNLLNEGLSTLEISIRLNLQLSTVSTYKHRIFEKLKVTNIVDLIEKTKLYSSM